MVVHPFEWVCCRFACRDSCMCAILILLAAWQQHFTLALYITELLKLWWEVMFIQSAARHPVQRVFEAREFPKPSQCEFHLFLGVSTILLPFQSMPVFSSWFEICGNAWLGDGRSLISMVIGASSWGCQEYKLLLESWYSLIVPVNLNCCKNLQCSSMTFPSLWWNLMDWIG